MIRHTSSRSMDFEDDQSIDDDTTCASPVEGDGEKKLFRGSWVRSIIALVALVSSLTLPYGIYVYLKSGERAEFERAFNSSTVKATDTFGSNFARMLSAADSLSVAATSHALATNSTWPCVTLWDYGPLADSSSALSGAILVDLHPFVRFEDRDRWEECSVTDDGWINETLAYQNDILARIGLEPEVFGVPRSHDSVVGPNGYVEKIFTTDFTTGEVYFDESNETAFVGYQSYPVDGVLFNFDYHAYGPNLAASNAMKESNRMVIGPVSSFVDSAFQNTINYFTKLMRIGLKDPSVTYSGEPSSSIHYPIFDSFEIDSRTIVGAVSLTIIWPTYFNQLLPPGTPTITCVVENTCESSFTMEIDGTTSSFVGLGDLHDLRYDNLEVEYKFDEVERHPKFSFSKTTVPIEHDFCAFSLHFYPSEHFEESFTSHEPLLFAGITGAFLLVFGLTIVTYGWILRRRFRRIIKEAIKSGSYVSSIFPEHVRQRLMQLEANIDNAKSSDESRDMLMPLGSRFIADLYPNCSVVFIKVAGFNRWISTRDPVHIFVLLEGIFQALDRCAKRYKIFKVETVAETFLAVAGIPNPQDDHASRTAKFARSCIISTDRKLATLADELGPDTMELQLQIGIHSGPVTAGVMGGQQKTRFQVFGDTVNTASRLMISGQPGRIHLSSSTASIVCDDWCPDQVEKRTETVHLKGKGSMETFWLQMNGLGPCTRSTSSSSGGSISL